MGIFGAPDVDWTVALDDGRLDIPPGGTVSATISFRPHDALDARRVMAALIGTEEYDYNEKDIQSSSSSTSRTTGTNELFRNELQLLGPTAIGAGETRSGPVQIAIPADALPSLESKVLRVRWKLFCWLDVGGRDPQFEQQLIVPLTTAQLNPADAASMGESVQVTADDRPAGFWTSPAPLRAGQPFSGALDVTEPLDLGSTHVELKLRVETRMAGGITGAKVLAIAGLSSSAEDGISDSQVLWRGPLTDGGPAGAWRRYLFSGQLPLAPVVTAIFPHGAATAVLDVVTSRRLRTDSHISRPVAIVTG